MATRDNYIHSHALLSLIPKILSQLIFIYESRVTSQLSLSSTNCLFWHNLHLPLNDKYNFFAVIQHI